MPNPVTTALLSAKFWRQATPMPFKQDFVGRLRSPEPPSQWAASCSGSTRLPNMASGRHPNPEVFQVDRKTLRPSSRSAGDPPPGAHRCTAGARASPGAAVHATGVLHLIVRGLDRRVRWDVAAPFRNDQGTTACNDP